ncbi:MAG: FG-GAP-like repeat-containing protein [Thermoguttaceae bacterium]
MRSAPHLRLATVVAVGFVLGGCQDTPPKPDPAGISSAEASADPNQAQSAGSSDARAFVDVTDEVGVRFTHHKPVLDKKLDNIMPWMASVGASVAAVDYDGDGDIDLYVTNSQLGKPNGLYRNNGDGTFTEVAVEAGVDDANREHGVSTAVAFGDYDSDGHLDLYVVKWGWNLLYRNNGDGTFTDVTDQAGVGDRGNGNAAVWFDYDDDSHLDLYVGNYFRYVDLWNLEDSRQMHEDFETARDAGPNVLYHNNGDGTFTEVAAELGVDDTGWTLDVGCADYDNDGDQDLVLANDFGQDRVYRTNADGTFTDVTDQAIGWDTNKGMNVDFGDYNNDGNLDLYITNIWTKDYVQEGNQLYRNLGDGTFTDISFEADVYDAGWAWAGRFWDYDNDGDLDLIVANGYISADRDTEYFRDLANTVTKPGFDSADARNWPTMGSSSFAGYEPMRVWRNDGDETFTEVAAELGLADVGDGRGLAIADFDDDGDLDVYVSNQGQDGVFYRNRIGAKNNWLKVDLASTTCNPNAIGARVTVVAGGLTQIREVNGGNGDHSQCPYRLHFGLGDRKTVELLEVRWSNGYVQRLTRVEPNRTLAITEDTPPEYLAERRLWKEAQLEARKLEIQREQQLAAAAAQTEPADDQPTQWAEMAKFKREYLRFTTAIHAAPANPQTRHDFALLLDKQGRHVAALDELERAIQLAPDRLVYGNTYRELVRRYGHVYFDRSIRFFEDLAEKHPKTTMVRLNKALAYVDKMPYPKLGIVHQGILSNKSLEELDAILLDDPTCWTAKFIRGMNHLHWPRKLGHAPTAITNFSELIAMQQAFPPEKRGDHFALAYVALGDAYVKNRAAGLEENLAKARQSWRDGLKRHPDSPELQKRLEMMETTDEELIEFVRKRRGLEDPVDTDLSRVWGDTEDRT